MFTTMDDCAQWLKSKEISAEVGLSYIFINFEDTKHPDFRDKNIPSWFVKELSFHLPCTFTIRWFVPDPNDPHELWYCRKQIPSENGFMIVLQYRLFGDGGGPVFTEDL